jgi:excisionase family DNA binding protein
VAAASGGPPIPLLTLQQVGELLGVKRRTLQSWRAAGKLRVVAFNKRCLRVEQAELDRLIQEARQ